MRHIVGLSFRRRGAAATNGRGVNDDDGRPNDFDTAAEPLLEVTDLKVHFPIKAGILRRGVGAVRAVDGVSFSVHRGETVGLVGESGLREDDARAVGGRSGAGHGRKRPVPW